MKTEGDQPVAPTQSPWRSLPERRHDEAGEALHGFQNLFLPQPTEVKHQTDVRRSDNFDYTLENAHTGIGSAENATAVLHHRSVVQVIKNILVSFSFARIEIQSLKRK